MNNENPHHGPAVIYLVSGFMRSGTSMMMRALEAGGLTVAKDTKRTEAMNARWGEVDKPNAYLPNDDYYEMLTEPHLNPRFPAAYDGKLVKVMYGGVIKLPLWEYRAVFMRRPANDIKLSMLAAFDDTSAICWRENFDSQMQRIVSILRDRRSFLSVDEVWYDDVLADPRKVLASLDWPIDAEKAARIPSSTEKRFAHA